MKSRLCGAKSANEMVAYLMRATEPTPAHALARALVYTYLRNAIGHNEVEAVILGRHILLEILYAQILADPHDIDGETAL